jgi:hypothetical protein
LRSLIFLTSPLQLCCETAVSGEQRTVVWRVGLLPDRKISARQQPCPPEFFAE